METSSNTLEQLVSHFLASKRSLASYDQVWQANSVVTSARSSLEDIVSLNARNRFMRHNLGKQLTALKAVRHGTATVYQDGRADFKALLRTLDTAHAKVNETLQLLKTTQVDVTLRPGNEQPKHLHDFVDEQGVDELTRAFRECIDRTNDAQNDFADSNDEFDSELRDIEEQLSAEQGNEPGSFAHLASLFRSLENHATEMADLLQSLVRNYDLCLTALKHTEGGGEAVREADIDLPVGVNVEMLEREAPRQPMSDEDLIEIIQVLDKDAAEVDDVVQEIRDRATQMESQLELILSSVAQLQNEHEALSRAMKLLKQLSQKLSNYINASTLFLERWNEQKTIIVAKMDELKLVREFYDGFLGAYDGLMLEVSRRKTVQAKMEKIASEAIVKLERLYHDDVEQREAFRKEHGEFLPSDIWPGLVDAPKKFEITEIGSVSTDGTIQKSTERSGLERQPG